MKKKYFHIHILLFQFEQVLEWGIIDGDLTSTDIDDNLR